MKFNKTITFEAAKKRDQLSLLDTQQPGQKLKSLHAKTLEAKHGQEGATAGYGLSGVFIQIQTDFTTFQDTNNDDEGENNRKALNQYKDQDSWPKAKRDKVKKVRFVICILALFGMAMGLMSRLMLNVSIVEMVKKPVKISHSLQTNEEVLSLDNDQINNNLTNNPLIVSYQDDIKLTTAAAAAVAATSVDVETISGEIYDHDDDDGLRFDWNKSEINMILGSFYLGYAPGILFSGTISELYGAKYPLFISVFGSAIINVCTPLIARQSLYLLMVSRIVLGLIQGSLFPALYELFNKWLTQTESSIFAPMTKVSMPMGSLIGTLMPGLLASFSLPWPLLFYIGGALCLIWSIIWFYVATSTPQTNRFVEENELERIMRKKQQQISIIEEKISNNRNKQKQLSSSSRSSSSSASTASSSSSSSSTPWLLIITNPSVLALTLVKFTYNIGVDFLVIMLPTYLSSSFGASTETISAISSCCFIVQMILITFVGWLAKIVVNTRAFGLSVTKWRKVFQGGSNLLMACAYLTLALSSPSIELSAILMLVVCSFWMLGAGGESMVPYDLSSKYPASILSFAHSIAICSGVAMPLICNLIVGEKTDNPSSWAPLFFLLAALQAFGGIVFCLVLKSKPFLPEEKTLYKNNNETN